jgi:hypothetical protein
MSEIIVSKTGYSRGWGSDRNKTVSGLSEAERQAVRNGQVVLIGNCPPSRGGNGLGTTYRQVIESGGRFYHRVPSDEILRQAGLS